MKGRAPQVPLRYGLMRWIPTLVRNMLIYLAAPKVSLGASAVIWDTEGRVFLVHHTYRRPGWGFPSGLVGHGEQPAAALARELREELSIRATVGQLLHAEINAPIPHLTLYYTAQLHGTPRHDGTEIDGQRYVALEDLEALVGAPAAPWLLGARVRRE